MEDVSQQLFVCDINVLATTEFKNYTILLTTNSHITHKMYIFVQTNTMNVFVYECTQRKIIELMRRAIWLNFNLQRCQTISPAIYNKLVGYKQK